LENSSNKDGKNSTTADTVSNSSTVLDQKRSRKVSAKSKSNRLKNSKKSSKKGRKKLRNITKSGKIMNSDLDDSTATILNRSQNFDKSISDLKSRSNSIKSKLSIVNDSVVSKSKHRGKIKTKRLRKRANNNLRKIL
jgi:hypothetical protein